MKNDILKSKRTCESKRMFGSRKTLFFALICAAVVLFSAMAIYFLPTVTAALNDEIIVEVNEENFPDPAFRAYIRDELDTYDPVGLNKYELDRVFSMDISGLPIKDLTGIGLFPNLAKLSCENVGLSSLDVSSVQKLKYLYCGKNVFSSVTLGDKVADLYISGATVKTLDLRGNPTLESIDLSNGSFENVIVRDCPQLSSITVLDSVIGTLDLGGKNAIRELTLKHAGIERLDLSGATDLKGVTLRAVEVISVSLNGCTNITSFQSNDNPIKEIDLSGCTSLTSLTCSGGELSELDIGDCIELKSLDCSENQLTQLDIGACNRLNSFSCDNNKLETLDVSGCNVLASFSCNNNELTSLDLGGCLALNALYCMGNELTYLDVSKNVHLERLQCSKNKISELVIKGNPAVKYVYCSNNKLTRLDISDCTKLYWLDCSSNELTSIDISKNPSLRELDCSSNEFASFDFKENSVLRELNCSSNKLTALDVSPLTKLQSLDCSSNLLTSLDVSKNQLASLRCAHNLLTSIDCGESDLVFFDCSYNKLKTLSLCGSDEFFSLYCNDNELTSLDLSRCTTLDKFDCSNNRLTSLDLSQVGYSSTFYCAGNELTELDLSKLHQIRNLDCSYNKLTSLILNPDCHPWTFKCSYNRLSSLSVIMESKVPVFSCVMNECYVYLDGERRLDLTALGGFDPARASNLAGGSISGNMLTFDVGADFVTYDYDVGDGRIASFKLTDAGRVVYHGAVAVDCASDMYGVAEYYSFGGRLYRDPECKQEIDRLGSVMTKFEHKLIYVMHKEATCCEDGITEHWSCEVCGRKFVGENKDIEIFYVTYSSGKAHLFGAWEHEGERHWRICLRSGRIFDEGVHTYNAATCNSPETCSICYFKHGEVDPNNHTSKGIYAQSNNDGTHKLIYGCCGGIHEAAEPCSGCIATCLEAALCESCKHTYGGRDMSNHVGQADKVIPNYNGTHDVIYNCCGGAKEDDTPCSGGTALCNALAVCATCFDIYGEYDPENHASSEFSYRATDDFKHWKMHACCGARVCEEEHSYDELGLCACDGNDIIGDKTDPIDETTSPEESRKDNSVFGNCRSALSGPPAIVTVLGMAAALRKKRKRNNA